MAENDFERTEAPTARRRQEAREEGNVARSTDLSAAVALLAAILLLFVFGSRVLAGLKLTAQTMLASELSANPTRADDLGAVLPYAGRVALVSVVPVLLGAMAAAIAATVGQVGLLVTTKPLELDFTRLSPIRGIRGLLDARAAVRLVMSLFKVALVAAVAIAIIVRDLPRILALADMELMPLLAAGGELVYGLSLKLAALLVVLALFDYAFQRWNYERQLRMTKEEVKEELKRMEGDPLIKQRRSRVARQIAMQRVAQAVPRADVVVTNPTHFAVALRYEGQSMAAPKVIAKGADFMAQRIRHLAMIHGVPMVERKELARALYQSVEVGQEIPPQFYGAVAEILAYVYRLSGRKSA